MRPAVVSALALALILLSLGLSPSDAARRTSNVSKKDERQNPLNSLVPVSMVLMLLSLPFLPLMMAGPLAMGVAQPGLQALGQRLPIFGQMIQQAFRPQVPVAAGVNPALFLAARGRTTADNGTEWTSLLRSVDEAVIKLSDPQCRSLMVCQMHRARVSGKVASVAVKLADKFGLESRLERSSVPGKGFLRQLLKAARHGLERSGDCRALYAGCRQFDGVAYAIQKPTE